MPKPHHTVKSTRIFLLLLAAILTASCGDDNEIISPDGSTADRANANKNATTTEPLLARLEFPRVHGGTSRVLIYKTEGDTYDTDGVNYAVEWDGTLKTARWSCYQMHTGYTGNYSRTSSSYPHDPQLEKGTYFTTDYIRGSGYDHGHICPNADRTYSEEANKQTFYLTNMQPQYHAFNGYSGSKKGLWLRFEDKVRTWTKSADVLYVCKGGTIDREDYILERIQGQLIVPKYFFVALLAKNAMGYKAVGFFMEHKDEYATTSDLSQYALSIDQLEAKTGIDFFCNLPDKTEDEVEAKYNKAAWAW